MSTPCPLHFLKAYATDLYNAQLETFQTSWQYQKFPQDLGNTVCPESPFPKVFPYIFPILFNFINKFFLN